MAESDAVVHSCIEDPQNESLLMKGYLPDSIIGMNHDAVVKGKKVWSVLVKVKHPYGDSRVEWLTTSFFGDRFPKFLFDYYRNKFAWQEPSSEKK